MKTKSRLRLFIALLPPSLLVAYVIVSRHMNLSKQQQSVAHIQEPEKVAKSDWDAVDQASWESFPASDTPGWRL